MPSRRRSGFTLLEIIIAMGLFSLLMAAVLECLSNVRSYASRESVQNDLVLEGRRLVDEVVNDFAASAWYLPAVADGGPQTLPVDQMSDPNMDRSICYYPYIQVQSVLGLGSQFPLHARASSEVIDPSILPADLPFTHRGTSQEVIFVKVRTGPAAPTPHEVVPDVIDFNVNPLPISVISGWRNANDLASYRQPVPAGVPRVRSLSLQTNASGIITDLPLKWESVSDALQPSPNIAIREYTYVVVPNPSSGKGRLERRYRNGCGASVEPLTLDKVLSENLDRMVVDTYRTDKTLNLSQIRFTFYLSREMEEQPDHYVTQRIEITTALRSLANGLGSATLATRVGAAGAFGRPLSNHHASEPAMSTQPVNTSRHLAVRSGSILPVAFFVLLVVGSLMVISSDRVLGVSRLQSLSSAKLQAIYAAEAVAARHEFDVVNLAASNALVTDPASGVIGDSLETGPSPNFGSQWFGNCVVRWRIEPVIIEQDDTGSGNYTVNPAAGSNLPAGDASLIPNNDFYTYRIATEAYYIADPELYFSTADSNTSDPTYAPWKPQNANMRLARVQCSRVVAISLVSLFKYAIFYAANGPVGDLEFWVGTSITVKGAVHSNGAIYIGGQGAGYLSPGNDYHGAASGGGDIHIGTLDPADEANKVPITGINGIYRMRKGCNILATQLGVAGASTNPAAVPLDGQGGMTGSNNLNGDDPASTTHTFNGIPFNSSDDSRSPNWLTSSPFGDWVRDSTRNARPVTTLSNIPELAGRPFEPQRIVGDGQILYDKDGVAGGNDYTINPTSGVSKPVYRTGGGALTLTAAGNQQVYASEMPLFSNGATTDIANQVAPTLDPATQLPTNDVKGVYLNWALNGNDGGKTTGLAIRERGAQYLGTYANGAPPVIPDPNAAQYVGNFPLYATDYAQYLRSNYAVFFNNQDITSQFIDPAPAIAAGDITKLTLNEDQFHDRREAFWLNQNHGTGAYLGAAGDIGSPTSPATSFLVNALTLNIAQIQTFLKTASVPGGVANTKFDGVIYAHRTPRLTPVTGVYDPQSPWLYNPIINPTPTAPLPFNPGVNFFVSISGAPIGQGPQMIPGVGKAIRVAQGSDINYGITQPKAANRPQGLTIITPNHCYLWTDFNIITYPDDNGVQQITPCALFADGITALSNAWTDAQNQNYNNPIQPAFANGTTYTLSLLTNNVPTTIANAPFEGSGAVANVVKFLEFWNGNQYRFTGSLVVMNQQRYSLGDLGASQPATFYSPPSRILTFNTDLLTAGGQPPASPHAPNPIRAINTVQVIE